MKTFTMDPTQFLIETMGFTNADIGAYMRLMIAHAATEKPIERQMMNAIAQTDDLHRVIRLFDPRENGIAHHEIERQIDERDRSAEINTTRARAAANARHGKPKPTVADAKAAVEAMNKIADAPPQEATNKIADTPEPETSEDWFRDAKLKMPPEPTLGTTLPEDFQLTGTHLTTAKAQGCDMDTLAQIFDEFRQYHARMATVHPDWNAAFEKWFERKRPKKPKAPPRVVVTRTAPEATGDSE